VQKILVALSTEGALAWENKTGEGHFRGGWIRFGLHGSSDIIGCLANGKFLAIEVKTGSAVQAKKQTAFQAAVLKRGGHYGVARSVDDAVALAQHWQRT
jgi:hypothetical protein